MEPSSKRATGPMTEQRPSDTAKATDSGLGDFLSRGLRESQRPPAPSRPSAPPANYVVEATAREASRAEAAAFERASDRAEPLALDSHVHEQPPTKPDAPDASTSSHAHDDARASEIALVADEPLTGSEADYVVPVGLPSRSRIVAVVIGTALMGIAVIWWLSRDGKASRHVPAASPAAPVQFTHEPLPPPPPPVAEAPQPSGATDEEPASLDPNGARSSAGAPTPEEPSAARPFGQNVARFPDLPTPVLIELEHAQQEKQDKKPAK